MIRPLQAPAPPSACTTTDCRRGHSTMAAAPDAAAAFAKYDRNGNGAIEVEELRAMLKVGGGPLGQGAMHGGAAAAAAATFACTRLR